MICLDISIFDVQIAIFEDLLAAPPSSQIQATRCLYEEARAVHGGAVKERVIHTDRLHPNSMEISYPPYVTET